MWRRTFHVTLPNDLKLVKGVVGRKAFSTIEFYCEKPWQFLRNKKGRKNLYWNSNEMCGARFQSLRTGFHLRNSHSIMRRREYTLVIVIWFFQRNTSVINCKHFEMSNRLLQNHFLTKPHELMWFRYWKQQILHKLKFIQKEAGYRRLDIPASIWARGSLRNYKNSFHRRSRPEQKVTFASAG